MRAIPTEDIHPLLLGILSAFVSYCEKYELEYFAAYGTLIGAVRHKGFIPWDDDADVIMQADAYEKLKKLAEVCPYIDEEKRYRIFLPGEYPNFYPFVKIVDETTVVYEKNIRREYGLGVWIDVFCFSNIEDEKDLQRRRQKKLLFWKQVNKLLVCGDFSDGNYKRIAPIAGAAARLLRLAGVNNEYCVRKMISLSSSAPEASETVSDLSWGTFAEKDIYPKALFEDTSYLPFETIMVAVPARYDEVLKIHYGDYMALPPIGNRQRHEFDGFYLA